jgi:hypothetical protein
MARSFAGGSSTDRAVSQLTTNNNQRTYSIWTYRTGDGGGNLGRIWHKGNTGAGLDTSHNNNATDNAYDYNRRFSVSNGIWRYTRPSANAWHHICVVHDSSSDANDPIIYVDGVSQSLTEAQVPSGTVANNAEGYCVGNRNDNLTRAWDGHFAEFGVWNRLLTPAEIAALAQGVSPAAFPHGLVEHIEFLRENVSRLLAPPTLGGTTVVEHPRIIRTGRAQTFDLTADVAVALSSVSATAQAGNLAVDRSSGLTGAESQASAGSVAPSRDVALSGVSAALAEGNIAPSLNLTLSGNQAATDLGILTPEIAILLPGQTATGEAGTVNVSTTIPVTGNQAQATVGSLTAESENNVTVALTGVSASAAVGTLTPSVTRGVSGVQSDAVAGDVSVSNSRELASLQAAGEVGSVGPQTSKQISGIEISPQSGSVTGAVTIPVTGTVAASVAGVLSVSVDKALTGVHATGSAGTLRLRSLQALPEDVITIEKAGQRLRVAHSSATLFATLD